jgi:hypothetical protein
MTAPPAAPVAAPPELLRTQRNGCYRVRAGSLGSYLAPADDPLANAEISEEQLNSFELRPDFAKIPAALWSRWLLLCLELAQCDAGTLEVSCRLLRHQDDASRWRILVPIQDVCAASVRVDTFDSSVDIETGELVPSYPPDGWIPMGSSHSHNTMTLDRFSGTDDAAELGDPGVHILISHCSGGGKAFRWKQTDSVVAARRRFYLPQGSLSEDVTALEAYHPEARKQVMHLRPRTLGLPGAAQVRWTAKTSAPRQPWDEDPFFWSDIGFLPPGSPGPAPVDGPGEDLIALFGDDGSDEWLEAINAVFAGVESTLAYLLCSDQEQEAIDAINLLSRFADGDISPLSNHADSNDPTDRPA